MKADFRESLCLAVETSCDETAVAILRGFGGTMSSLVSSQVALHAPFGGVVPEVASRNHLHDLPALVESALEAAGVELRQIDSFAATGGPGLAPALLVGLSYTKGLALGARKRFLSVNHMEGHLLSPFFGRDSIPEHIGLIVSGGHTLLLHVRGYGRYQIIGRTLDDAAGEAFDKVAKLLGLPYPGGAVLDRLAENGNPDAFQFPRSMLHSGNFDFSFSGIKTAIRYHLENFPVPACGPIEDVCASFREAVVDVLVQKTIACARLHDCKTIGISGGVSANQLLQRKFLHSAELENLNVFFATPSLSTDNAAMIAFAAQHAFAHGAHSEWDAEITPSLEWFSSKEKTG